jgi:hypothetical protein
MSLIKLLGKKKEENLRGTCPFSATSSFSICHIVKYKTEWTDVDE